MKREKIFVYAFILSWIGFLAFLAWTTPVSRIDATIKLNTASARIHLVDDDGREVGSVDLPEGGVTVRLEKVK